MEKAEGKEYALLCQMPVAGQPDRNGDVFTQEALDKAMQELSAVRHVAVVHRDRNIRAFSPAALALLDKLTELQYLLNTADAEGSQLPAQLADQSNAYGCLYRAVGHVLSAYGHDRLAVQNAVNYGGNGSPYKDLVQALRETSEFKWEPGP